MIVALAVGWWLDRRAKDSKIKLLESTLQNFGRFGPPVDEATRDAAGKLLAVERVYWHQAYQVEDPMEAIAKEGVVLEGR